MKMHRNKQLTIGYVVLLNTLFVFTTIQAQTPNDDSLAEPSGVSSPSPLISATTLNSMMAGQASIQLIDVGTDEKQYAQRHIPNAQFVHWIDDIIDPKSSERYNLAASAQMQHLLQRLGISNDDHIVLYDSFSSRLATRFYWSLKVYNHRKVSVLDGGLPGWVDQGGALSNKSKSQATSDYQINQTNEAMSVDMAFVEKSLHDPNVALIDGRPMEQYSGEEPGKVFHTGKAHKLRGHIPGAVNVFWKDNFNADGTFKSKAELLALYKQVGISTGAPNTIVTYCNEGLHAAPPWFVLRELLGAKDVRVYDDSMSEWANSDRPMEQSPSVQQKNDGNN